MHITCLLAAAEKLAAIKSAWKGTLIVLFQPNEERATGADAMVDDGLYNKIPTPDFVFGQHVMPLRAGRVGNRSGTIMSAANSLKVTLFGRGGHGSMPHMSIDPIVLASNVVLRLQTIISREVDPAEMAVVTIGSIQAGHTENVIADQAVLRINIRTTTSLTRERILASVHRIIKAECEASRSPKAPLIESTSQFPLTANDHDTATRLSSSFQSFFKENFNPEIPTVGGSEDFSTLATSVGKPYDFWFIGGTDSEMWDRAEKEGRLHDVIHGTYSYL